MKVLVLDAMGVIYPVGDDVRDLLYPFVLEKHGVFDFAVIENYYKLASLGKISAQEFWKNVGLYPQLENEYLQRFRLTDGLIDFLKNAKSRGIEIWCLSNDLSEWSKKLRIRFGLEKYFRGFVISGDVGLRKPDPMIYQNLLNRLNVPAKDVLFVDDNPKNIVAAMELGIDSILFSPAGGKESNGKYCCAAAFNDILPLLD
jgi:HAD superfamily hydrolase (TIGR01509 family)